MSVIEGALLAGKYRVERVLARGGMGVVCAAIHTQLDQRVALKFLLPEGESNEHSRLRFLREARAAVRLRSEHVARVLDVGTAEEGAPYIVMEYLEGQDLAELLAERGRLPEAEAVAYVLQAAEAVAEAHALGIIHRDLKPANLFLTRRPDGSPCVKVLDFGISKALESTSIGAGLTQGAAMIGTPHYMSPEQIRSSRNVDARSDIWAMGMILYELVTGVVAFPRETLPELCSAIILDPIPPPRVAAPNLSEALERALTIALAKAPENRPQSLAELATLLAPLTPDGGRAAERIARVLKVDLPVPTSAPVGSLVSSDPALAAPSSDPTLAPEPAHTGGVVTSNLSRVDISEEAPSLPARRLPVLPVLGAAVILGLAAATFALVGGSPAKVTTPESAAAEAPPIPVVAETTASPPADSSEAAVAVAKVGATPDPSSRTPSSPRVAPRATSRGTAAMPAAKPISPADDFGARQ